MKIRLRRLDGNCQTFFIPKRNVEYEIFVFRQAAQLSTETLDSFHARLQQLSRHCDFADKERREIKSQVIQKCRPTLQKVRDKGLRDDTLGLQDLLRFARTQEACRPALVHSWGPPEELLCWSPRLAVVQLLSPLDVVRGCGPGQEFLRWSPTMHQCRSTSLQQLSQ